MSKDSLFSPRYISLVIVLLLTALSYHPSFSKFVTEDQGANPLNKYIYLMTGVTLIQHLQYKDLLKNKFAQMSIKYIILIAVVGFLLQITNITNGYISEAQNCLMAFAFLVIGYNAKLSPNQLLVLLLAYSATVIYSTFYQITINLGGFTLSATYLQYGKNILGVMTSSSCIALTCLGMTERKKWIKFLTISTGILLLVLTITIRARAAFLSTFFLLGLLCYKKIKALGGSSSKIAVVLFSVVILIILLSLLSNTIASIWGYIYESFTLNQGTDITSDRMNRNNLAIDIISNHLLFGNLEARLQYDWVHNYFLRQFSSYGLLVGFPILALYINLAYYVIKNMIRNEMNINNIGFLVFLIPLIISLEEPTFPYAPGTGVILSFIMLGYSIRNQDMAVK